MADERMPAVSAGARMHPVHPDDVRIQEGRDPAARGRRKKPRNKKQLAKKVVAGSAKVPLKSAVFLVTKTGKFVFKLPAQAAIRGTRGAYRKMKSRKRLRRGMIISEAGDHHVVEGPLHNWVNYVRGWRKRWFILEAPGLLTYYSNHKKKTCLGTIPLCDAVVTISRHSPLRFVVDTDYGVFYLRATSADQRDQWIDGIRDSQMLHDFQHVREPSSAGEGGVSQTQEHGPDDDGYEGYTMGDRACAGHGNGMRMGSGYQAAIDATELDERLALVDTRIAELVAENLQFSRLVHGAKDHRSSAVSNEDTLVEESAAGNGTIADRGEMDGVEPSHASTTDTTAVAQQMQTVVELMQDTLAALSLARAEISTRVGPSCQCTFCCECECVIRPPTSHYSAKVQGGVVQLSNDLVLQFFALCHSARNSQRLPHTWLRCVVVGCAQTDQHPTTGRHDPSGDQDASDYDDDNDDDDDDDDDDGGDMAFRWQGRAVQGTGLEVPYGDDSAVEKAAVRLTLEGGSSGSDGRLKHPNDPDCSDSDDYWDVAEK